MHAVLRLIAPRVDQKCPQGLQLSLLRPQVRAPPIQFYPLDYPCGIAHRYRPLWYIPSDDTSSTDGTAITDRHSWADDHAPAYNRGQSNQMLP